MYDGNGSAAIEQLSVRLKGIMRQAGGQIYPAKSARMPRNLFERDYPALPTFM